MFVFQSGDTLDKDLLPAMSTSDIPEGSSAYFTTTRARASVGASTPLVYDSESGTFSMPAASVSANGYLTFADWSTFNAKEPGIAAGTASQYWRGDKSWQTLDTLAVPENTNLYFTPGRVLGTALDAFVVGSPAAIASTDTVLSAFGKTQAQIDSLASTKLNKSSDTMTGELAVPLLTGMATSGVVVRVRTTGDTSDRFSVSADGSVWFGLGSVATDVVLSRHAAGELKIGTNKVLHFGDLDPNNIPATRIKNTNGGMLDIVQGGSWISQRDDTTVMLRESNTNTVGTFRAFIQSKNLNNTFVLGRLTDSRFGLFFYKNDRTENATDGGLFLSSSNEVTATGTVNCPKISMYQSSGYATLITGVNGEAYPRIALINSGTVQFGTGAAVTDTTLSRQSAGELQIVTNKIWHAGNFNPDNKLNISGGTLTGNVTGTYFAASRPTATDWALSTYVTGEANPRFLALANGILRFGPGTVSTDTSLSRHSAGELQIGANKLWHAGNLNPTIFPLLDGTRSFTGAITAPGLKVGVNKVVGARVSGLGAALSSLTASASFGTTEQTMLQEAHDNARLLKAMAFSHGLAEA